MQLTSQQSLPLALQVHRVLPPSLHKEVVAEEEGLILMISSKLGWVDVAAGSLLTFHLPHPHLLKPPMFQPTILRKVSSVLGAGSVRC
jgi:hypothetical protein